MPEVVFKCKQPLVLNAYDAQRDVDVAIFNAKCDEFSKTVGGRSLFGTRFFDGGWAIRGYTMHSYTEELPVGWRQERHSDNAVPAKRTPEGKEIASKLNDLHLKGNKFPGVPKTLFAEGYMVYPRTEKIGEDWWLTLSKTPVESDRNEIDSDLWEPAKLSEYYAAKETADA
jgi:hypothetical protein